MKIFLVICLAMSAFSAFAMGSRRKQVPLNPPKSTTPQKSTKKPVVTVQPVYVEQGIGVTFYVTRKTNGQGNEKWFDRAFVNRLIDRVNTFVALPGHKMFVKSINPISNDNNFNAPTQNELLVLFNNLRLHKQIVVIITGEDTQDSAGLAFSGETDWTYFALRSRYNGEESYSETALNDNAQIFLHELGHKMGLAHWDGVSLVHTDNFYGVLEGRNMMDRYLSKLNHSPLIADSGVTPKRDIAKSLQLRSMKNLPDKGPIQLRTDLRRRFNLR